MKITLHALKYRAWLWLLLCAIAIGVLLGFPSIHTNAARNKANKKNTLGNYDIRALGGPALTNLLRTQSAALPRVQTRLTSLKSASAQLRTTMPDANVQFSPLTGAAEVVSAKTGTLTQSIGPTYGDGHYVRYTALLLFNWTDQNIEPEPAAGSAP